MSRLATNSDTAHPQMPEPSDYGSVLVQHLERIRRSVRLLCRTSGINESDAEDCCSWVVMKIVEDDYAVLRKFEGRSLIATYLTVVVARLVGDWRTAHWGRWRLSAEAKRLGPVACMLERLIYRDGCTLAQAIATIRSAKGAASPSDRELIAIFAKIPRRSPIRPRQTGEAELQFVEAQDLADRSVDQEDQDAEWQRILEALDVALNRLDADDAVIARMRFFDGLSVAQIARALSIDQKPLYRRMIQVMSQLRAELDRLGFPRGRFTELLEGGGL
ncbi:MAG: sigma-70 family RNA polymerase sigma factor [Gemmatimonadaceae bacterium]